MQGLMVLPCWMDYSMSPAGLGVLHVLQAFRKGLEDTQLQMTISGEQGPTSLRALTSIPIQQWPSIAGRLLGQAVNARTFSRRPDDALARKALQIVGA